MAFKLDSIGDVARLVVYSDLKKVLTSKGYMVEISSITVRVYKDNKIKARIWMYPDNLHAKIWVGTMMPHKLLWDDPEFFNKVVALVSGALGAT